MKTELLMASSESGSTSSKAKFSALTDASSKVLHRASGMGCFPFPFCPKSNPPKTIGCRHRGDLSSAPLATAFIQSSTESLLKDRKTFASGEDGSGWRIWIVAVLNMPITWTIVRRPSGLFQIAGADSSCADKRVTFNGLERSVSRLAADPSSLYTF